MNKNVLKIMERVINDRRSFAGGDEIAAAIMDALDAVGFAVVPLEPTKAMIDAGLESDGACRCDLLVGYIYIVYRDMIAAWVGKE